MSFFFLRPQPRLECHGDTLEPVDGRAQAWTRHVSFFQENSGSERLPQRGGTTYWTLTQYGARGDIPDFDCHGLQPREGVCTQIHSVDFSTDREGHQVNQAMLWFSAYSSTRKFESSFSWEPETLPKTCPTCGPSRDWDVTEAIPPWCVTSSLLCFSPFLLTPGLRAKLRASTIIEIKLANGTF